MPRKTKKQKILALQHRQNLLVAREPSQKQPEPEKISSEIPTPVIKFPENSYFFGDLKKSLILSTIVVALEIALYYARLIK